MNLCDLTYLLAPAVSQPSNIPDYWSTTCNGSKISFRIFNLQFLRKHSRCKRSKMIEISKYRWNTTPFSNFPKSIFPSTFMELAKNLNAKFRQICIGHLWRRWRVNCWWSAVGDAAIQPNWECTNIKTKFALTLKITFLDFPLLRPCYTACKKKTIRCIFYHSITTRFQHALHCISPHTNYPIKI